MNIKGKNMSKLTIREIAKMAGVSPTAVSFVLNNKDGVSEETRKKVNEVIEKTNFQPSLNSRRLFFKKSYNITVVMRQTASPFDDLFYFEITKAILTKIREFGYNMVFSDIHVDGGVINLPDIIKYNDTDGIIFLQDTEKIVLNEIEKRNIPYVVIDAHTFDGSFTFVSPDYTISSYTATKYLIDNGHRDIAFITKSSYPSFYFQTFNGFKKAMEEINIPIQPSWVQIDAADEVTSFRCMEKILKSPQIPTAVFCSVDVHAIGAIKCAKYYGYKVPDEISFIGIDDVLLSRYYEPNLTTIRIDKEKMGNLAIEMIMKKIAGEQVESVIVESNNIVIRDTVKCIK